MIEKYNSEKQRNMCLNLFFHQYFNEEMKNYSICLWIINILQMSCIIFEITLINPNINMPIEFYQLSHINFIMGSVMVIGRLLIGSMMMFEYDKKCLKNEKINEANK